VGLVGKAVMSRSIDVQKMDFRFGRER